MMKDKPFGEVGILSNLNGLFNAMIKNYNVHTIDRDNPTMLQLRGFINILRNQIMFSIKYMVMGQ